MRDDEHHLQTVRYNRDETQCEREAEKDGELMDRNIGKPESKPTWLEDDNTDSLCRRTT